LRLGDEPRSVGAFESAAMKNLATFDTPIEAQLLVSRLAVSGITGRVRDEQVLSANLFASHSFGGVKVEVAEEDYEKARSVLTQYENNGPR
jgi:hypothetical protein